MDGRRPGGKRSLNDLLLIEVGLSDRFAFEDDHLICHFGEQTPCVVGRTDGDRWMPSFLARTKNSACNFTAVGHQDVDCNPSSFRFRFPVWRTLVKERRQAFLSFLGASHAACEIKRPVAEFFVRTRPAVETEGEFFGKGDG